jgi:hypothetical protein
MIKNPTKREARKPKTAKQGKRYRCAICKKRSPHKIFEPAPWYHEACKLNRILENDKIGCGT